MADMDVALALMPGKKKLNLHASYSILKEGERADRNALVPEHFAEWVKFAKERDMGIDFNPTFFSHEKAKDGLTLTNPDENLRQESGKALRGIQSFRNRSGVLYGGQRGICLAFCGDTRGLPAPDG